MAGLSVAFRHLIALLVLAVLFSVTARPGPASDFGANLGRFHEHYDKFLRQYTGCPKGAVDISECDRNQGVFDYAEFLKAAKEARSLFSL